MKAIKILDAYWFEILGEKNLIIALLLTRRVQDGKTL
jgi:hypothetical protein